MMENSCFPENNTVADNCLENEEEVKMKNEDNEQNNAGNRWPRQETLALLKIRSEMDVAFRDSGVKAPLWEEVSRKLAELGHNRSAKKCKEKFENIYKYHRRTKDGRSGRSNGKNYRFFEQLEALDHHPPMLPPASGNTNISREALSVIQDAVPCSFQNPATNINETSTSTTSSSSKESDGTRNKKRKLTEFFERLMKEVMEKQENLQRKLIEAIEKSEQERLAREEVWKMQELARIKRERELLAQERSIAAAKDAAVLAFLQKFSDQTTSIQLPETPFHVEKIVERQQENSNCSESFMQLSSSRWPKDEVEALIKLRTNLDLQYQDNGPKGPLWEEISTAMKKLGYDRSAKRCKEKWENMNKYFKRVKESNKKRPEDSKTCPYFHQLDALYKEKTKKIDGSNNSGPGYELKPEELLMHMMGAQDERAHQESATEDGESENADQNPEENGNTEEEEEEDEEGGGNAYRVVANDPSPMAIIG